MMKVKAIGTGLVLGMTMAAMVAAVPVMADDMYSGSTPPPERIFEGE